MPPAPCSPFSQHLADIKGLSEAKVDKMVECAKKLVPGAGWRTGTEALQARAKDIIRIKVLLGACVFVKISYPHLVAVRVRSGCMRLWLREIGPCPGWPLAVPWAVPGLAAGDLPTMWTIVHATIATNAAVKETAKEDSSGEALWPFVVAPRVRAADRFASLPAQHHSSRPAPHLSLPAPLPPLPPRPVPLPWTSCWAAAWRPRA